MITDRFVVPSKLKTTGVLLTLLGLLSLIIGGVVLLRGGEVDQTRFWAVLLHNSVFFLLIATISIFIQAASALAQGGWIVAYKRIPEAIGANVWVFGLILLAIVSVIVLSGNHHIYEWLAPAADDQKLLNKTAFLNKYFYLIYSVIAIVLWSFFGKKFRSLSLEQEKAEKNSTKLYWKNLAMGGAFLFVYGLTVMSVIPWLWIMSIDAHWYSTLFSWYVFASAFVSGMSVILLWTVYLKNQGNLQIVTKEHMHDLGKFMFAFSIFWTYLWFAQYMLIWYGNVPEETTYFQIRQNGPYGFLFYGIIVLNFVMPILILMTRPSKRNYFTVVFMAIIIIFGHWLDFYVMMMPGTVKEQWHISWYEIGIALGFIGVFILAVSKTLAKADLVTQNNILLKETLIHIS